MSFSPETVRDPEFSNGAQNRRLGMSKTQSSAHLKNHRASQDSWLANRAGWDFMNVFLMMKEIDEEASKAESAR